MKKKQMDSHGKPGKKKQPNQAEDFTWDESYEEEHTSAAPPAGEAEDLFSQAPPSDQIIELALEKTAPAEEERPVTPVRRRQNGRRQRRSYKKGFLIALAALCAVFVLGLIFSQGFYNMLLHNTSYTLWDSGQEIELPSEKGRISGTLNHLILSGGTDGVSAYRADQTLVWNISYTMTNPVMRIAGDYALILDVGGRTVLVCGPEGLIYQASTQYAILNGSVNESGWTTVIGESVLEHEILVYSGTGERVLRRLTKGSTDGQPVTAVMSGDGNYLVTAYAAYNSNELVGKVTFFDLTVSGGTFTDRISANFVYPNTIVTDLIISGNKCVAVGDNLMAGYELSGVPQEKWSRGLSNQIQAMDSGDAFFAVIYGQALTNTQESLEHKLVVYNMDGNELYRKDLEKASYLQAVGDLIVYGEGRSYVCLDTKGRSKWFYNALEDVQAFYPVPGEKQVIRTSGNAMHIMNIVGAERAEDQAS